MVQNRSRSHFDINAIYCLIQSLAAGLYFTQDFITSLYLSNAIPILCMIYKVAYHLYTDNIDIFYQA